MSTLKNVSIILITLCVLTMGTQAQAAEVTSQKEIRQIQIEGNGTVYVVATDSEWGAPSCPTAYYAYIPATLASRKEMLAGLYAAQVSKTKVTFSGDCLSGSFKIGYMYFN